VIIGYIINIGKQGGIMSKKNKTKYTSRGWGRMKLDRKEPIEGSTYHIGYKCDKLCNEIQKRLRAEVKVYTSENYSQEFLRSLVDKKNL